MKTSHFPSIPYVASRDPTMARCRVRRGSIGTSEIPCHRSDSRSRNSNDPFPELSLQERTIQAAAARSLLLVFWNFHTSSSSQLLRRSFSIDKLVPLRDGNDYRRATQTICQVSVPQLGSEFVSLPFTSLWGMIKVHIINSKRMEM